ncbi:hypothetical protein DRO91_09175 [Candidatus Heimdallarchaeota archaeon]|nr:MAG: hypothetical protein DRO91_09175 [Candidatus Heimdallarchaeota archaeon]
MSGKTYKFFKRIVRKKKSHVSGKIYYSYYITFPSWLVDELNLKEGDHVCIYVRKYYPKRSGKNG